MAVLLLLLAALAPAVGSAAEGMRYMSLYDYDPKATHGWINLGLTLYKKYPGHATGSGDQLAGEIVAFEKYGVPALAWLENGAAGDARIFQPGIGLTPGWEAAVEARAAEIKPHLGPGKAIRGVALGDELCCRNVTCWRDYEPYTAKLRQLLGKAAIIFTNECWLGAGPMANVSRIAPDFDLFSVDAYQVRACQPQAKQLAVASSSLRVL